MPLVHAGGLAGAVSLAVEDGDMEAVAEVCPLPLADAGKVQAQDEGCEGSFGSYEVVLEDHRHVLEEVPLPDAVPHVGERDQIVLRQVSGLDCCLVLCELWRSGGGGGECVCAAGGEGALGNAGSTGNTYLLCNAFKDCAFDGFGLLAALEDNVRGHPRLVLLHPKADDPRASWGNQNAAKSTPPACQSIASC